LSLKTLGGQLGMHPSRLADFESGHTRGKVKWLEHEEAQKRPPADEEEWEALLRDTSHLPVAVHPPLDISRDGIYGVPGDGEI
jgi:hypothetical protein